MRMKIGDAQTGVRVIRPCRPASPERWSTMTGGLIRGDGLVFEPQRGRFRLEVDSFSPEPGVHVLAGLNGSGKSTLVRLLSGVLRPQKGSVSYRGEHIADPRVFRDYCASSGYLWQDFTLHGGAPLLEYLVYRAWLKGYEPRRGREVAEAGMHAARLEAEADKAVGKLSGGMQRRVGIAAETLGSPTVLLLDEPTSGLDLDARERFFAAMDGLVEDDATVVMAAHEVADIARYDATVHVMDSGSLVSSTRFTAGELTAEVLRALVRPGVE